MVTSISTRLQRFLEQGASLPPGEDTELFALLSLLKKQPAIATWGTPGAESSNTITVACTITDVEGVALAVGVQVLVYTSSDAAGLTPASGNGEIAAGTNGTDIGALVTNTATLIVTATNGVMDVVVTETGADDHYLNVVLPNGEIITSTVLNFAT